MTSFSRTATILTTTILITACSTFTSPARKHMLQKDEPYWMDYAADRRGAIIYPKNTQTAGVTFCAEPSPDVALDIVSKFNLEGKAAEANLEGKAGAEVSEKVIQLAKRTQTIMFLRESLYRLCELSANQGIPGDKVVEQYEKVVNSAIKMAEAELVDAQTNQKKADAELQRVIKGTGAAVDAADKAEGK